MKSSKLKDGTGNMIQFLNDMPDQVDEALSIGKRFAKKHKLAPIQKILFCGLGGSAISGDIIRCLALRNEKYPFLVFRSVGLPKWVDSKTLVILSSYSGNTEEVLAAFKQALKVKAKILVVTSGGKLAALAKKHKRDRIQIPDGLPPRCAVGYLTFAVIPALKKHKLIQVSDEEIRETVKLLKKSPRTEAKSVAKKIVGRTLRLYGISGILDPVVVRWRAQIAENSKLIVSSCFLPEMFHNEIEGWQYPKNVIKKTTAIFFTDKDDPKSFDQKRKIGQRVIKKCGARIMNLRSKGKGPLARIFSLIYLGDWISYELALLHKVDPMKIPAIDAIKRAK